MTVNTHIFFFGLRLNWQMITDKHTWNQDNLTKIQFNYEREKPITHWLKLHWKKSTHLIYARSVKNNSGCKHSTPDEVNFCLWGFNQRVIDFSSRYTIYGYTMTEKQINQNLTFSPTEHSCIFFLLRQVVSVKTILLWCFCLPMMMLMIELINNS